MEYDWFVSGFFFFQAEDGIRDYKVTGVQTCALPILRRFGKVRRAWVGLDVAGAEDLQGWKRAGGLRVTQVAPGGPAGRAGVAAGDVLVGWGEGRGGGKGGGRGGAGHLKKKK